MADELRARATRICAALGSIAPSRSPTRARGELPSRGAALALISFIMNKTSGDERPRADRPTPERAGRPDDADAFFPDPTGLMRQLPIPDTESFAQEFIDSATSANMAAADAEDEVVADEFIVLEEDAKLPPDPGEAEDGAASVERENKEQRGANWAARGV